MKQNKSSDKNNIDARRKNGNRKPGQYPRENGADTFESRKMRRKNGKRRRLRITLGVLLLLAIGMILIYSAYVRPPDQDPDVGLNTPDTEADPPEQIPTEDTSVPLTPDPTAGRKNYCYTFLIAGIDKMSNSSDTLMVGMLDTKSNKLNIVSIPRDTLANLSWDVKKINSCYSAGGIDVLMDGVKQIFGFSIDKYIIVDIEAFQKLVDSVEGVWFDVPVDMYHADETQIIDVKKGYQLLNGHDALGVVRFRDYPMADIERIHVQQEFLKASASQMLKIGNVTKIRDWAKIFDEYVDTNLELRNLIWYGEQFLKLSEEDLVFSGLPCESVWIRGGSYISIIPDEWLELVNLNFNPYYEQVDAENMDVLIWDEQNRQAISTRGESIPYTQFYKFPNSTY